MLGLVVVQPGQPGAYGAFELKRVAHRYGFFALSISVAIHFSILGLYYFVTLNAGERGIGDDFGYRPPIVTIDPAPPIPGVYELPSPAGPPAIEAGDAGTPSPVADNLVPDGKTIAPQKKLVESVDPHGGEPIPRDLNVPVGEAPDETPPPIFVAFEKEPMIVSSVAPVYPPLALKAGIEGKVWVKIWVDRQGKNRKVEILKGDEVFNEAAIEAAKQFVFTPAYMNNGPVSVWVSVPFTFRLAGGK